MYEIQLTNHDGNFYADSREVAEVIERKHCDLLRTIKGYCDILTESTFALSEYFVPTEYEDSTGRKLPRYLITKKGCDMIANKVTGKKGVLFSAAYASAFEKMKEQLEAQTAIQYYPAKSMPAGGVSSLIKNVRIVMERQNSHPRKIARQTELLLTHFGIPVIEDFVETTPWEQIKLADT